MPDVKKEQDWLHPKMGIYNPLLRAAFTNITEEEFVSAWGGEPIKVPAGRTVELPHHLAVKLTKELELESYISFVGWVKDKKEFYNNIDIFCLPSLYEPFGIIVLEAMEFGVPIVCTKTQGPSEIIRDQVDGLLCTIGSSDELAEKLAFLIDNQVASKKYTQSSYLRLQENYETSIIAGKLANFIKNIKPL